MAADRAAFALLPILAEARAAGATSLHQLAAALNAQGVPTPSGKGAWTATAVRRVQGRILAGEAA